MIKKFIKKILHQKEHMHTSPPEIIQEPKPKSSQGLTEKCGFFKLHIEYMNGSSQERFSHFFKVNSNLEYDEVLNIVTKESSTLAELLNNNDLYIHFRNLVIRKQDFVHASFIFEEGEL